MATFLDDLIVGALLLASVTYAAYSLGPKTVRQRLLMVGGALLPGRLGSRLQRAAAAKSSGACGGCDNCGAAEKTTVAAAAGAPNSDSTLREVRVPLSQITKRTVR
jgi:hypothetical protein